VRAKWSARIVIEDFRVRCQGWSAWARKSTFRDDVTGQVRIATLVYPEDAGKGPHTISVLTPVGAALIGLIGQPVDRISDAVGRLAFADGARRCKNAVVMRRRL
jgi:hypothetical protein